MSPETKARWESIYKKMLAQHGNVMKAKLAANIWLKKHMQTQMTARSIKVRNIVRFTVDTSQPEFIKRSDSGEEYIIAMLEDVYGDVDGVLWTPDVLQKFADHINAGNQIVGDIDHEEYDKILSAAMSDEEVEALLAQKKGIAKGVKAVFEDGKLWMKALIDKRYKKALQGKNLSLEAVVTRDDEGRVVDGKILGFTFIVNDTAANPRTTFVDA